MERLINACSGIIENVLFSYLKQNGFVDENNQIYWLQVAKKEPDVIRFWAILKKRNPITNKPYLPNDEEISDLIYWAIRNK